MSLLQLKNVTLGYNNQPAIKNVSFEINKGDFFCVVGSNGSGKSTLLKGILGLIPLLGGSISSGLKQQEMGYVPQTETAERGFPATVREIVLTGRQKKAFRPPFYSQEDRTAAEEAMTLFEINHLANNQIGELSGGQQKRVMLARAMCRRPALLLLDEPCAGLDAETRNVFYATLSRLNKQEGLTVIMISHDLEDIRCCAHKIAVISRGLVFLGDVNEWAARYVPSKPEPKPY